MLHVKPLRAELLSVKPGMSLSSLLVRFAVCCIFSGATHHELLVASDNEIMMRSENIVISQHGVPKQSIRTEQHVIGGVAMTLDMFSLLDGFQNYLKLPSWAPDLTMPSWRKTMPFLGPWYASGQGQMVPEPIIVTNSETSGKDKENYLTCRGAIIDIIDGLGAIQSLMKQRMLLIDGKGKIPAIGVDDASAQPLIEHLVAKRPPRFTPDTVQPSSQLSSRSEDDIKYFLWRALIGGADHNGKVIFGGPLLESISLEQPPSDVNGTEYWIWDFIHSSKNLRLGRKDLGDYFSLLENQSYDPEKLLTMKRSMASKVKGRRLFTTSQREFIGLGPMATSPGDVIAILAGLNRPVVIRPKIYSDEDGVVAWSVIGECFIDGVMEGDAINISFLSDCNWLVFV
jgi:hypothetical protein